MASFLDNSTGDITLDAVLTDYGRQLLAKGDGSFNIVKFAFGDDEIDYGLFDTTAESPNQDAELMSTPILQAFTNNAASLKSKLLTLNIDNLLFLPILKLNTLAESGAPTGNFNNKFIGYVLPVQKTTEVTDSLKAGNTVAPGVLYQNQNNIKIDQGLDSTDTSNAVTLVNTAPALYESEYDVFVDNRFVTINNFTPVSIDDDNIAVYRIAGSPLQAKPPGGDDPNSTPIVGTRGSTVSIKLSPTQAVLTTNTYFTKYGSVVQLEANTNFKTLRVPIRVVGVNTGYSIDISVLLAKI